MDKPLCTLFLLFPECQCEHGLWEMKRSLYNSCGRTAVVTQNVQMPNGRIGPESKPQKFVFFLPFFFFLECLSSHVFKPSPHNRFPSWPLWLTVDSRALIVRL